MKSSLIVGNNIANAGNNDITSKLWDSQNKLDELYDESMGNPPGTTNSTPSIESIGFHLQHSGSGGSAVLDTDSIDKLFNKNSSYQLPVANEGDNLGSLNSSSFGLDIILKEKTTENISCKTVRESLNLIRVQEYITGGTFEKFEHWFDKQICRRFLDPSCLFGSYFFEGFFTIDSSNSIDFIKQEEIYTNVVSKFLNSDRIYLDISTEFGWSLNQMENYDDEIRIRLSDSSSYLNHDYYLHGWPCFHFNNSIFSNQNSSSAQYLDIQLPNGSSTENPEPIVYVKSGFLRNNNSTAKIDRLLRKGVSAGYIAAIELIIPNSGTNNTIISSFISINYFKSLAPSINKQSSTTTIRFNFLLSNGLMIPPSTWTKPVSGCRHYVSDRMFFSEDSFGVTPYSGVMNTIIAMDENDSVTYCLPTIIYEGDPSKALKSIDVANGTTKFTNSLYSITNSVLKYPSKELIISSSTSYEVDRTIDYYSDIDDPIDYFFLTLTSADIQTINSLISSNLVESKFGVFINFINSTIKIEDFGLRRFLIVELEIIGYKNNAGAIETVNAPTSISKYFLLKNQ
ncbi:hypothetical protein GYB22_13375 [bacterium]|nr:hypothetical protein [bacterium]